MRPEQRAEFLQFSFCEALRRAESGIITTVQEHFDPAEPRTHVWYDNNFLVVYGAQGTPLSVHLCGTNAVVWPDQEAGPEEHIPCGRS